MPRTMNLANQKAYRDKYYKGYLRAFSESWIARQPPEAQARYRAHNEKVKVARAIAKAQREARKLQKEAERESLRLERLSARADRRGRPKAA